MENQSYKQETFSCSECGWAGPGHDCKPIDSLKNVLIIGCPDCETRIRAVPLSIPVDRRRVPISLKIAA